ncbi:family 1 glycosylhydrolase [Mucilaginibacter sp. PAMB04168]|uniref:family 1 glycosylhydrolase n=1 Tax=Mucilaginibacter sp. PAMB04168 TaxID=3138567 RepID=UPI0031F68A6B
MKIWGGIECTINRVSDSYIDQLTYSGHYNRPEDIKLFAELGVEKLRYPVLWEKHQPDSNIKIDWTDTKNKLNLLKEHNIDPIAGLVHHGSGPAYVNMLEDSFVYGLAEYAGKVAEEFPWINYYTPVNEPLTTARFCGLYGIWHPHGTGDKSFLKILINECKATTLAMQAIRKVNPNAKLVQTEDLGKIHSTPLLKYQADFENHRRWLSFDLLCGKVTPSHALYRYIIDSGINAEELTFFTENPCTPDIFGFNYYLTSERYLDENIDRFPEHTHGSNGRHTYADVEVLRVGNAQASGIYALLKEAWERYHQPMAITEVHLHCTREEQLRWIKTIWDAAVKLKNEKVDVRGITAWALLGSFGWNRLLTQPNGDYEPGVFDVLSGYPRATALTQMLKCLSKGEDFNHPVMNGKGWWEREIRVLYNHSAHQLIKSTEPVASPLLIVGKSNSLAYAFARVCKLRNIRFKMLSKTELDITNRDQIERVIQDVKPWAIINTADFLQIDHAEIACNSCYELNTQGAENLSYFTGKYGIKLVNFSTDLVFDGEKNEHYLENDLVKPLNIYGQSKALAEECVLKNDPSALVVRTGALFSAWDSNNYVISVLNNLKSRTSIMAEHDVFVSPTYVPDLVNAALNLLIDGEYGIWHLANHGSESWANFATELAQRAGYSAHLITPVPLHSMDYRAVRPKYSALKSQRGMLLPSLDKALNSFFDELRLTA